MLQLATIGGPASFASGAGVMTFEVDYAEVNADNFILVPPGTIIGIASTGAAGVIQTTIYWKEVPA